MSRKHTQLTEDIVMVTGHDHALGNFLQVYDDRFAHSSEDPTGDGIMFDWDELFGITVNHIGLTLEELTNVTKELIITKCNEFNTEQL